MLKDHQEFARPLWVQNVMVAGLPGGNNSFGIMSGNFECKDEETSTRAAIYFPIDDTISEYSSAVRLFFM